MVLCDLCANGKRGSSEVSGEVLEVPEGIRFQGYEESSFSQRFGRAPRKFHGFMECSGKVPGRVLASGQVTDGLAEGKVPDKVPEGFGFWIRSPKKNGIMNQILFPTFFSRCWGYHLSWVCYRQVSAWRWGNGTCFCGVTPYSVWGGFCLRCGNGWGDMGERLHASSLKACFPTTETCKLYAL